MGIFTLLAWITALTGTLLLLLSLWLWNPVFFILSLLDFAFSYAWSEVNTLAEELQELKRKMGTQ